MLRRGCARLVFGWLGLLVGCDANDRVLSGSESPETTRDASDMAPDATHSDASVAPSAPDAQVDPGGSDAQAPLNDAGTTIPAAAADCDLNGVWMVKQQTVNVALALPQTANNWYFFELRHEGAEVRVVDHFDCGIEVLGTVHVQIKPEAVQAMLKHNLQQGRRGMVNKGADGTCAFKFDRFWSVRGADEMRFAPADRASSDTIEALAKARPLPTKQAPDGAEDWDGDGQLGVAWYVEGIVSGTRHSVQRDYTEWFSDAMFRVTPALDWPNDFVVRSNIGSEEQVLAASNATLGGAGAPDASAKHRVTFRFLGRDRDAPRAREILKVSAAETCLSIREAMPAAAL
jgi:hypothetical protein